MKKILSWIFTSILVFTAGCATISMQYNLMESMKSYQFAESVDDVYAGAQAFFQSEKLNLNSDGKNTGTTQWKVEYVTQGSLSHSAKVRYKVTVHSAPGNKSILRVFKESIPDKTDGVNLGRVLGSEILTPDSMRDVPIEFQILKHMKPTAAAKMEADAAK